MGEFSVVFRNTPALGITSNGSKTTALIKWESQATGNGGVDSADNKLKFYIKQDNNVVIFKRNKEKLRKKVFNKSKDMKVNIKKATEFYDKKIHYCVVKGYRKC